MEKQRKKPVIKLRSLLHRPGQPPVPVDEMSTLAPGVAVADALRVQ